MLITAATQKIGRLKASRGFCGDQELAFLLTTILEWAIGLMVVAVIMFLWLEPRAS